MKTSEIDITPMLNAYPDSVGKNLEGMLNFLQRKETQNIIGSFYIKKIPRATRGIYTIVCT